MHVARSGKRKRRIILFPLEIGGALVLVNRYVPLGLTLLGPVIFNILLFHALLAHQGWQPGVLMAILWIFLMFRYKKNFAGIFEAKPAL